MPPPPPRGDGEFNAEWKRHVDEELSKLREHNHELREDLNQRRNEALAGVQESATRVINQIAEQERFDLILQEAVFASGKIDITDKVIKALADK